jgi:hypothetical protein
MSRFPSWGRNPELAVPAAAAASLAVSFLISSFRSPIWGDEILTWLLMSLPTPGRMLAALADQVDNSPPLFYLLAWGWARLLGTSPLSLRLISCLGIIAALLLTWGVLRRAFPFFAASLGTLAAFCLSWGVLRQLSEARAYGLYLALAALALWCYERLLAKGPEASFRLLASNTLVHAGLVLTHYFGLLYSGIFLGAFLSAHGRRRVFPFRVYASVLLGWLALIPWLGPLARHRQTGIPHSWIPVPGYRDLLFSFQHALPVTLLLLFWLAVWWWRPLGGETGDPAGGREAAPGTRTDLAILAFLLICLPPVMAWAVSRSWVSVFWERYFLPGTLGWAVILSALAQALFPEPPPEGAPASWCRFYCSSLSRRGFSLMLAAFLAAPLGYAFFRPFEPPPLAREDRPLPPLPLVIPGAVGFLECTFHSPHPERCHFLLDWEAALHPRNSRAAVDDYHAMAALKRHFPRFRVLPYAEFLEENELFLYVSDENYTWFDYRIRCHPDYTYENLSESVILVRKNKNN